MREMKDSGIEWVGKVPATWKIMPNKYIMTKKKVIKEVYDGENIISLSMNGVIIRDLEAGGKMPKTFDGYQIVYPGNLLMCLFDYDVTPRCIGLIKDYGVTSPAYSQFVMNNGNYSGYYYYYYLMIDHTKALLHLAKNLRHSLTEEQLGAILAPVPTIEEQQRIVDFLDFKCSKIDASVEDIQKEISLLEEYKKSVITEAVTKGLNPDVEMKDSGIEGIKEIPVISKVVRLKYLVDKKITDGTHKTPEYATVDDGSPFLSSKDVRNGYIDWSNVKYITKTLHNILHKEVCCKRGDILLAKNGTTGVAALVDTDDVFDIYVTLAVIRSDKKKVLPEYLLYSINSNVTKEQFSERLVGIGVPNLHLNVIENTNIIVYEISEQQKIVKYLNEKCSCIDDAILIKKKQLEMLADYKKSLIYEYVTGKKEVPHE